MEMLEVGREIWALFLLLIWKKIFLDGELCFWAAASLTIHCHCHSRELVAAWKNSIIALYCYHFWLFE